MTDTTLSQDEIDALLSGATDTDSSTDDGILSKNSHNASNVPSSFQEVADLTASAHARALSATSTKNVAISSTSCQKSKSTQALMGFDGEVLRVEINYSSPVNGVAFYLFKKEDVIRLASLMTSSSIIDLDEMALSVLEEAFNQMTSSFNTSVNNNPESNQPNLSIASIPHNVNIPDEEYFVVKNSIEIKGEINSEYLQLYPVSLGQELASSTSNDDSSGIDVENLLGNDDTNVDIQGAEFSPLSDVGIPTVTGNMGLLLDVPMEVTVELGRSTKTVQEVLSLGEGSIIELDKLAGETVDLLVNGKPMAKGEVVVIDENFGVRVTEIVSPKQRISTKSY